MRRTGLLSVSVVRSRQTQVALGVGIFALLVNVIVLGAVSEDVAQRDGETVLDARRLQWIVDHRQAWLVTTARWFDTVGAVGVVAFASLVVAFVLWSRGASRVASSIPLAAVATASAVAAVLKIAFDRARPGRALQLVAETGHSFPSGHATASMAIGLSVAMVTSLYMLRKTWVRIVVLLAGIFVPVGVGATRLELGVHWPTDVLAGFALGAAAALTATGVCVWIATLRNGTGLSMPEQQTRFRRFVAFAQGSRKPKTLR